MARTDAWGGVASWPRSGRHGAEQAASGSRSPRPFQWALRDGGMDDGRRQAKGGEQRRRIGPDAVVELRDPHLDGEQLTFDVRVGEGDLAGADGPASILDPAGSCPCRLLALKR
jgi:hypothetical protein